MILHLTAKERDVVAKALSVLADEYHTLSDAAVSPILQRGFRNDSLEASNLAGRALGLEETASAEELLTTVRKLMAEGRKIDAIKYVRAHQVMHLKEAKDFVEAVGQ